MFRARDLLPDLERFLVKRFGFGVLAHRLVQPSEVVEALGDVGMLVPKDLLPDPQRFLKRRFGFGVLAQCLVELGQVTEADRRVGMIRATHTPCYLNSFFCKRNSLSILSFSKQLVNSLIEPLEIIVLGQGY
jgi:hypothetical protein